MRPVDADRMVDAAYEVVTKFMFEGENVDFGKFVARAMYEAVVAAAQDAPTLTEDEWNEWRATNGQIWRNFCAME